MRLNLLLTALGLISTSFLVELKILALQLYLWRWFYSL
ncbi:hypothetical protein COI_0230 [Mannheimia haemolytica serotype A2 str. OVINE]|nr:hypothetical protein COI_0230 [Mannheimia haemolytica serotype A2 str. OVINE]